MKFEIELDDYEVINLLHALKFIPNNGNWLSSIKNKINTAVGEKNLTITPNSGIDLFCMEKHINLLKWKNKNKKDMFEDLSYKK